MTAAVFLHQSSRSPRICKLAAHIPLPLPLRHTADPQNAREEPVENDRHRGGAVAILDRRLHPPDVSPKVAFIRKAEICNRQALPVEKVPVRHKYGRNGEEEDRKHKEEDPSTAQLRIGQTRRPDRKA